MSDKQDWKAYFEAEGLSASSKKKTYKKLKSKAATSEDSETLKIFPVSVKVIKEKGGDKVKGVGIFAIISSFTKKGVAIDDKEIVCKTIIKKVGTEEEIKKYKEELSKEGKKASNIKNITLSKSDIKDLEEDVQTELTLKVGDLIQLSIWEKLEDITADVLNLKPTYECRLDNVIITNSLDKDFKEKSNGSLDITADDLAVIEDNPSDYFSKILDNYDLCQNLPNIRESLMENNGDDLSKITLSKLIGEKAWKPLMFNTGANTQYPNIENTRKKLICTKDLISIGEVNSVQNSDKFFFEINLNFTIITSKVPTIVQFSIFGTNLTKFGANPMIIKSIGQKLLENSETLVTGNIEKSSIVANKDNINSNKDENHIVLFVNSVEPVIASLVHNIGLEINLDIVKYLAKRYFKTTDFTKAPNNNNTAQFVSLKDYAQSNELNYRHSDIINVFECDRNLNDFNDEDWLFFIIDENDSHKDFTESNLEQFKNDKKIFFSELLKKFEGKESQVRLCIFKPEKHDATIKFILYAIKKETYNAYVQYKKEKDSGQKLFLKLKEEYSSKKLNSSKNVQTKQKSKKPSVPKFDDDLDNFDLDNFDLDKIDQPSKTTPKKKNSNGKGSTGSSKESEPKRRKVAKTN